MLKKAFFVLTMLLSVLFFSSSEYSITGVRAESVKISERTIQKEKIVKNQSTLQHLQDAVEIYPHEMRGGISEAEGILETPVGEVVKTFWENDIYITVGTGPCFEDDSEVENDYLPQLVFEDSKGCHGLMDLTLSTLTRYKYLLLIVEGEVKPDAYPYLYAYAVGSGKICDEYSMIALELPEEDCVGTHFCPLTNNLGGFPSSHSYRDFVLGYISDLLSVELKSTEDKPSFFEKQFIGVVAANEKMVNVLIEEGYLIP